MIDLDGIHFVILTIYADDDFGAFQSGYAESVFGIIEQAYHIIMKKSR